MAFLGYALGIGGPDLGAGFGPIALQGYQIQHHWVAQWIDILYNRYSNDPKRGIVDACTRLALHTQALLLQKMPCTVIGGDHSCAMGTWSGVAKAVGYPIGLLWIDAHLDAHTFETTPSQNIHGMPLAALLGAGDPVFTQILDPNAKLSPHHCVVFGYRSFEPQELEFLTQQGVTLISYETIQRDGLAVCWQKAMNCVTTCPGGFGLSLDLDAFDPQFAPGVSTPVPSGLSPHTLLPHLERLRLHPNYLAGEIVEFNPHHDQKDQTQILCHQIACILESDCVQASSTL